MSAGIGSSSHLLPVYDDFAVVGLMLQLPVLKKIQSGMVDVAQ
jgi:hypothetical protein